MIRHAALVILSSLWLGSGLDSALAAPSAASFRAAIAAFGAETPDEQERRAKAARAITHDWLKR